MPLKPKLGFDNYSLRAFEWKASRLIEYAASLGLDTVLLSDPDVFENHSAAHLKELRTRAGNLGIELQVGMLSICPGSKLFDARRGAAATQLRRTIGIAKALGSPVARCVLGHVEDRKSPGGIGARIAQTVKVLKQARSYALDSGVKIAVENHAGDMQSRELVALIQETGRDFVGATMDAGNATWALEDPLQNLETLGPYALTTGIRDSALWDTPEGAMLQWTAMGEGLVDWTRYFKRFAELCPNTPVQLEIISGRPIPIPYLEDDFWSAYPKARIGEFTKFAALARRGSPRRPFAVPPGKGRKISEQEFQRIELERSVKYCKETLGLGRNRE